MSWFSIFRPPVYSTSAAAFKSLVKSNFAAQLSEQIALACAPLVAVLALGATASQTGGLQTAQTLPFLLFALPAGVLADRYARRTLMLAAEAVRAGALLAIVALLASQALQLYSLALLGFIGAAGTVLYSVAAPALVPQLVSRAHLTSANRSIELARSIAFVAGPAMGGSIVGAMGASTAYVLATMLSLVAFGLLVQLPRQSKVAAPAVPAASRAWLELCEGATFVCKHALLRPLMITALLFNTAWFIFQAVYVAYAIERLALNATGVGLTLGCYGAGMVAGALIAPVLSRHVSYGTLVVVGPASALMAALLMLATTFQVSITLAACAMFLFGAGPILWTIATTTLRQTVTPNALLGRVSSVILAATYGARPIGAGIGAIMAAQYGVDACLWASTLFFAAQFAMICVSPVRRLVALPREQNMST